MGRLCIRVLMSMSLNSLNQWDSNVLREKLILLGFISMTVFLRTKMPHKDVKDGVIILGAMFLGLVTHLFNGFVELAMGIVKLPIFYKQRDLLFYPSWAYAMPTWILKIPISFLECAVWVAMTYYVIGFDPNIQRFFRRYMLLVLISQVASGLFHLLATLGREMVVADTFGSFAQIVLLILGGFLISRDKIKKWWIWGYWSSPLMYATNAVAVNEFLGHSWNKIVDATKVPLGVQVLIAHGIFVDANWYWIGVGALIGYIFLFNILFVFFLDWLDPLGKGQTVVSEEDLREKHANRTGESVKLLPPGTDSSRPSTEDTVDTLMPESHELGGLTIVVDRTTQSYDRKHG